MQIKDSTPRGTWKIRRIVEMIKSQDGEERAARIMIHNKNILQRLITHLYPIEGHEEQTQTPLNENPDGQQIPGNNGVASLNQKLHVDNKDDERHIQKTTAVRKEENDVNFVRQKTRRKAAQEARDKIVAHSLPDV